MEKQSKKKKNRNYPAGGNGAKDIYKREQDHYYYTI